LEVNRQEMSIATGIRKVKNKKKMFKSLSDWGGSVTPLKKVTETQVPLTQEEYGKLVREA
jgi:hypothetical protein